MLPPFFQSSMLGLGAPMCWRPLEVQWSRCMAGRRRVFKQSISDSSFSSTFSSSCMAKRMTAFKQSISDSSFSSVFFLSSFSVFF